MKGVCNETSKMDSFRVSGLSIGHRWDSSPRGSQADLAQLRAATARFHRTQAAQAAGYGLVPGLDYCFDNPGVGGMGYHYINTGILDLTVDKLHPEAMVYTPGPNGTLQLGAVEYIVPAQAWDVNIPNHPPYLAKPFSSTKPLEFTHCTPGSGRKILRAYSMIGTRKFLADN